MTDPGFDLDLPCGRLRAERLGPPDGDLALCVHGLSANVRGFDAIAPALAESGRQVVAVDLRGRGRSEITPPGSYGLDSHVADVLAVADALGAERFDVVGWSMGALIGIRLAGVAPQRLRRVVLIDHAGHMDQEAVDLIIAGLARLDAVVPSPEPYLQAMQAAGAASPWGPFWERYYRYELAERADGTWTPTTDRAACTEDVETIDGDDFRARWAALTMPVQLVRATVPLGGGLIVPAGELAAFREAVPHLEVVEIDRNHFGVVEHPDTAAAIAAFLAA